MIQNIIVALIVAAALAYTGYSIYRSVMPGQKPNSVCGGCTGCDLKNRINSCEHPGPANSIGGIKNKVFEQKFKH